MYTFIYFKNPKHFNLSQPSRCTAQPFISTRNRPLSCPIPTVQPIYVTHGIILPILKGTLISQRGVNIVPFVSKRDSSYYTDKDKVVSITYEEIGLFPRSFSRVLDRFLKQLFSDVDNLVIQEYRFYRYLFLTTIKTIFILFFVPFLVNFAAKNYIVKPITEYFWNTSHPEIFLNSYEQKRAFVELAKFEEKIYFETLVESHSHHQTHRDSKPLRENGIYFPDGEFLDNANLLSTPRSINSNTFLKQNIDISLREEKPLTLVQGVNLLEEKKELNIPLAQENIAYNNQSIPQTSFGQGNFSSLFTGDREGEETAKQNLLSQRVIGANLRQIYLPSAEGEMLPSIRGSLDSIKNKDISKIYQEKTIELATYYNNHSIEAITNFFADLLSLFTLLYLLITLEIQINITKSFLLEVFFGLDDSKKSLLILLITDLLVGYHSSNLWELFFEFIFNHYGIPESQTGIFLLVATLPVLLDVLFKYLIFRHLNRSSPATVATYQAIIE
jgi:hypothetical protein|uniref:Potassium/proton antiporter CemA n=3 Tax=Chlamydomonas reinhardtii TaxID=3055 RepID=CEMA_CHLRE|nr:envelope membrane protein [Chlamydomonas reinhardtii]Q37050.1 RecName: Full=Potassium/proton antiporter CemA; AltName: Full=Chloroplast envelope membrane protein A; Short=CemA [Chlamydomonas reinhardtii]ACJ50139.1 envelope membrane protein [Chlamydomonas reinhardtii]ASF83377.1 envelope membrane protein [Chlamydomonas reinhardtii]ASF83445.1 envelope membrane protein [Chlamydomonas reinhardtii]ASF83510.1 envelope membrane protein [Chlamydomonas reinhardtii]ASF83576.1 envelope membrane protei|eukprot:NP_958408.1 envelope membrane protein (chloroplast) [Chlamydomonas reinhardtii]